MAEKNLPKINQIDRPFWQGAAEGKFLLQHCRSCGKLQFFPRVEALIFRLTGVRAGQGDQAYVQARRAP